MPIQLSQLSSLITPTTPVGAAGTGAGARLGGLLEDMRGNRVREAQAQGYLDLQNEQQDRKDDAERMRLLELYRNAMESEDEATATAAAAELERRFGITVDRPESLFAGPDTAEASATGATGGAGSGAATAGQSIPNRADLPLDAYGKKTYGSDVLDEYSGTVRPSPARASSEGVEGGGPRPAPARYGLGERGSPPAWLTEELSNRGDLGGPPAWLTGALEKRGIVEGSGAVVPGAQSGATIIQKPSSTELPLDAYGRPKRQVSIRSEPGGYRPPSRAMAAEAAASRFSNGPRPAPARYPGSMPAMPAGGPEAPGEDAGSPATQPTQRAEFSRFAPRRYTLRDKSGRVVMTGLSGGEEAQRKVYSAFEPVVTNAADPGAQRAARGGQDLAYRAARFLPPDAALKVGMEYYQDELNRMSAEKRAASVGPRGTSIQFREQNTKDRFDMDRARFMSQERQKVATQYGVSRANEAIAQAKRIKEMARGRASLGKIMAAASSIKSVFGAAASEGERAFVMQAAPWWDNLTAKLEAYGGNQGVQLPVQFMAEVDGVAAETIAAAEQQLALARQELQYVLGEGNPYFEGLQGSPEEKSAVQRGAGGSYGGAKKEAPAKPKASKPKGDVEYLPE